MSTAGCFGKLGYLTRADAVDARKRLIAKRKVGLKVYACACGRFHLGRDRREGKNLGKAHRKTADHHAGSYKARKARFEELTKE